MGSIPSSLLRVFSPIEHLLDDPAVQRVMVDGPGRVFVERDGQVQRVPVAYGAAELDRSLRALAQRAGKPFDAQRPCLEAMLKDGTRFLALCSPVVEQGPVLAISRPGSHGCTLGAMVAGGGLSGAAADLLSVALRAGANLVVAGPPGGGRLRALEALCGELPADARIATLQDGGALELPGRAPIRLTPRKAEGEGRSVTGGDLLYCAGRMAVDRVVVTDLRLADAWDAASLLAGRAAPVLVGMPAMTTDDALSRFGALARASAARDRDRAVDGLLAAGLDLVVVVGRWGEAPPVLSIDAIRAVDGRPTRVPIFERSEVADTLLATPEAARERARWVRLLPPQDMGAPTRVERIHVAEPSVAEPSVAEPSVAEPSVAEPSVAEPSVIIDPSVAEVGVPQPSVPQPSVPQPSVPQPSVPVALPGAANLLAPAHEVAPPADEAHEAAAADAEESAEASVDISVDLPPNAIGKTTEASSIEAHLANRSVSVDAPSLTDLVDDSSDGGDPAPGPPVLDAPPQAAPTFRDGITTSDATPDLATTQALDAPLMAAFEFEVKPPQAQSPDPGDSLAGGSALHRLLAAMDEAPEPSFDAPPPSGLAALDEDDDDEEEPTMITTAVGGVTDPMSKKTFSQVLRALGSPEDSVEGDLDSWPPSESGSLATKTRETPRIRDRNTQVHSDDD